MASKDDCVVTVTIELGHQANFLKEPSGGFTHDWTVFVRGYEGSRLEYFVEKVVFRLHETFKMPTRVISESPYKVSECGYAGFNLPIDIHFKNKQSPRKINFEYDLFLNAKESPPINNVRYEKLKFHNPTPEFKAKLLKAGGVEQNSSGAPVKTKLEKKKVIKSSKTSEKEVKRKKRTPSLSSLSSDSDDDDNGSNLSPPRARTEKEKEILPKKDAPPMLVANSRKESVSTHSKEKSKSKVSPSHPTYKEKEREKDSSKKNKHKVKDRERDKSLSSHGKDKEKKESSHVQKIREHTESSYHKEKDSSELSHKGKELSEHVKEKESHHSSSSKPSSTTHGEKKSSSVKEKSHKEKDSNKEKIHSKEKDTSSLKERHHSSSKDKSSQKDRHASHPHKTYSADNEVKLEKASRDKSEKVLLKRPLESPEDQKEKKKFKRSLSEDKLNKEKEKYGKDKSSSQLIDSEEKTKQSSTHKVEKSDADKSKHSDKHKHSHSSSSKHKKKSKDREKVSKSTCPDSPSSEKKPDKVALITDFTPQVMLSRLKRPSEDEQSPGSPRDSKSEFVKSSSSSSKRPPSQASSHSSMDISEPSDQEDQNESTGKKEDVGDAKQILSGLTDSDSDIEENVPTINSSRKQLKSAFKKQSSQDSPGNISSTFTKPENVPPEDKGHIKKVKESKHNIKSISKKKHGHESKKNKKIPRSESPSLSDPEMKKESKPPTKDVCNVAGMDILAPNGLPIGQLISINDSIEKAQEEANQIILDKVIDLIADTDDFDLNEQALFFDICSVEKSVVLRIQEVLKV